MRTVALIVTFNRLDKLKLCWAVTARQSFDHIVIVNNASTDGTQKWLDELNDPRLHRLSSEENSGGAGGFKMGACYIADNIKADWVFIYDDDAWPQSNIIEDFLQLPQLNEYDAFACKVVNTRDEICKMNLPWVKFPATLNDNLKYKKSSVGYVADEARCEDVITFSFVGLAIKYDALIDNVAHIFDEIFIYFDDVYFSVFLSNSGYRIQYTPELKFIHDVPESSGNTLAAWKMYYLVRNMLLDKKLLGVKAPFTSAFKMVRLAKYAMMALKQQSKFLYLRYFIKGIADGLYGRAGRRH